LSLSDAGELSLTKDGNETPVCRTADSSKVDLELEEASMELRDLVHASHDELTEDNSVRTEVSVGKEEEEISSEFHKPDEAMEASFHENYYAAESELHEVILDSPDLTTVNENFVAQEVATVEEVIPQEEVTSQDEVTSQEEVPADGASSDTTEPKQPPSPTVLATSIVSAAVGIAHHAAAQAYCTAKDVFHTWQAKKDYEPPQSSWQPPSQTWTPTTEEWTPQNQEWTPPNQDWTPQSQGWTPHDEATLKPEDQLLAMGFANRDLNRRLLEKHNGDIEKVIQELLEQVENDWHQQRH